MVRIQVSTHTKERCNLRRSFFLLNAPVAADSGFGRDCVRFALVEKGKPVPPLAMGEKVDLAETILNFCLERLNG